MYILVNHTKDWGIMEVGRFDMWQDAAREIAKGIRVSLRLKSILMSFFRWSEIMITAIFE